MIKKKMMDKRKKRHRRVRKQLFGTAQKPRLNVYRSLAHFYAQLINDTSGRALLSMSTLAEGFKEENKYGGNKEAAETLGKMFAEKALKANIKECVFDRGGYMYHGRVKVFAEAARKAGLKF